MQRIFSPTSKKCFVLNVWLFTKSFCLKKKLTLEVHVSCFKKCTHYVLYIYIFFAAAKNSCLHVNTPISLKAKLYLNYTLDLRFDKTSLFKFKEIHISKESTLKLAHVTPSSLSPN